MRNGGNVWCSACYCRMCICSLHRKEAEQRNKRRAERESYFSKYDWTSPQFAKQAATVNEVPQLN